MMTKNDYIVSMRKIALLLLFSFAITPLFGQEMNDGREYSITTIQVQELQEKVAQSIISYSDEIQKMQFAAQEEAFLSLFDGSAMIYDDLFGLSFKESMPISEYSHILATKVNDYQLKISDLFISDVNYEKEGLVFTATFNKECSYKNEYGVRFIPYAYYNAPYKLVATVVFSNVNAQPKITKITGSIPSNIKQPKKSFCIIERQNDLDDVRVDGFFPKYNEYGQAYTNSNVYLSCDDPNLTVRRKYTSADAHYIKYKVASKRFAIKTDYGIGLGSIGSVDGTNINTKSSSSMYFGLDLGVNFLTLRRLRLFGFTGFAVETNSLDIEQKGMSYEYVTDQDIDEESYIRKYSNVNLSETLSFFDYVVPLYVDIEVPITSTFCMYADLGARFAFAGNSSASSLSGSYKVVGKYPQYEGLVLDYTSGLNGFTDNGVLSDENRSSNYNVNRKSTKVKLMGQLGFRIHLWESLFLDIYGRYTRCMTKESATPEGAAETIPLRYNYKQNIETVNAFGNECRQSLNQYSIHAGIIYKL